VILNVAGKQEYRALLEKLRAVLDGWIPETHDVSPTKCAVDMYDWETVRRLLGGSPRLREQQGK
jgi:hypothetical protein